MLVHRQRERVAHTKRRLHHSRVYTVLCGREAKLQARREKDLWLFGAVLADFDEDRNCGVLNFSMISREKSQS